MKDFNSWNQVKINTEAQKHPHFKEGELFFARIGENVGFEACGKGDQFLRPVLVFRKFNQRTFWAIPMSTTIREGDFFVNDYFIRNTKSSILLSQIKLLDAKRLIRKIGAIPRKRLLEIGEKLKKLFPK
ncbi:MAG TPA: type II toxin-antitoxin system PemK/MazF family toxin [Candidatus Gracilibacteria bacterium]